MARRSVVVAVLAVSAAALSAAPATAGALHSSSEPDLCGPNHTVTFAASSGERNNVTIKQVIHDEANPLEWFPECPFVRMRLFYFADPTATIRPSGGCRFVVAYTNRAARCPGGRFDISLGDMNDTAVVHGFPGEVSCGPGRDTVFATETSRIASDCETVNLRSR